MIRGFKDKNSEDICLRYLIPLKYVVLQVDPGAACFRTISL